MNSTREQMAADFSNTFTDCTDKGLYEAFLKVYDAGAESRQGTTALSIYEELKIKTNKLHDYAKELEAKLKIAREALELLQTYSEYSPTADRVNERIMIIHRCLSKIGETHE